MSETRALDLLVEDYFTGNRCATCHQPITKTGCRHSREQFHRKAMADVDDWLNSLPDMPDNPVTKADKELARMIATAQAAAQATTTRSAIRAGYRDMPMNPDDQRDRDGRVYTTADMTVLQDERMALAQRFGIVPKWRPPTSIRTSRADNEPI